MKLVNTYTLIKSFLEDSGYSKKEIIAQHNFYREISLELLGYYLEKVKDLCESIVALKLT